MARPSSVVTLRKESTINSIEGQRPIEDLGENKRDSTHCAIGGKEIISTAEADPDSWPNRLKPTLILDVCENYLISEEQEVLSSSRLVGFDTCTYYDVQRTQLYKIKAAIYNMFQVVWDFSPFSM